MKYTFLLLILTGQCLAQVPTYNEVLAKEIMANQMENSAESMAKPYVIMVSIDGYRYDYTEKFDAKNLKELAQNGSTSNWLIPSFPSKTFPNHYSLVTGLLPVNHGIVSNSFYDKTKDKVYKIGDKASVEKGDWYGGVPLWNLAQLQGMCAASYFWVGSEANINGMHPKYYYNYEKNTPYEYRITRLLEWLQLPEKIRPHLITLYFSLVDTQGHKFGPDAIETKDAVLYVDQQIGALREGLAKLNMPVYLAIMSDHGMDIVNEYINIHDYVSIDKTDFFSGPVAMIYTDSETETEKLYNQLLNKPNFEIYKRADVPKYLNYAQNEKIGDLVLITQAPFTLIYNEQAIEKIQISGGTHGYDPYFNKNMGALFTIEGPNIKRNYKFSPVENVNVYPLIAHLLGLKIMSPIDGQLSTLEQVLLPTNALEKEH